METYNGDKSYAALLVKAEAEAARECNGRELVPERAMAIRDLIYGASALDSVPRRAATRNALAILGVISTVREAR